MFSSIGLFHFLERTPTIMAKMLSPEDLNDIRTAVREETKPQRGGTVAGATVTKDFAKQEHRQVLADGTVRTDKAYVEPPKA
jgi:uncharacterized protein with von Willebrand factor type A (vWA) domain